MAWRIYESLPDIVGQLENGDKISNAVAKSHIAVSLGSSIGMFMPLQNRSSDLCAARRCEVLISWKKHCDQSHDKDNALYIRT